MDTIRTFESSKKMAAKMRHGLPATVLLFLLVPVGEAVWLDVPLSGTKCVSEEIQSNVVVLADYIIISEDHSALPTISVKVTSPYGNNLHHAENVTHGQFAFTTQESGNYMACFWADAKSHGNKNVSINVDWKTGIAAKDWESIAKKEKIEVKLSNRFIQSSELFPMFYFNIIVNKKQYTRDAQKIFLKSLLLLSHLICLLTKGVELEIRKLEGAVEAIHENLLYLRNREAEMRTVSEKTNSRVAWYSIMSLGICIAVSGIQVVYLKQYFEKKKLI